MADVEPIHQNDVLDKCAKEIITLPQLQIQDPREKEKEVHMKTLTHIMGWKMIWEIIIDLVGKHIVTHNISKHLSIWTKEDPAHLSYALIVRDSPKNRWDDATLSRTVISLMDDSKSKDKEK